MVFLFVCVYDVCVCVCCVIVWCVVYGVDGVCVFFCVVVCDDGGGGGVVWWCVLCVRFSGGGVMGVDGVVSCDVCDGG